MMQGRSVFPRTRALRSGGAGDGKWGQRSQGCGRELAWLGGPQSPQSATRDIAARRARVRKRKRGTYLIHSSPVLLLQLQVISALPECSFLSRESAVGHTRLRSGNPQAGPIFANAAGKPLALTSVVNRVILPALNRCERCGKTQLKHPVQHCRKAVRTLHENR